MAAISSVLLKQRSVPKVRCFHLLKSNDFVVFYQTKLFVFVEQNQQRSGNGSETLEKIKDISEKDYNTGIDPISVVNQRINNRTGVNTEIKWHIAH